MGKIKIVDASKIIKIPKIKKRSIKEEVLREIIEELREDNDSSWPLDEPYNRHKQIEKERFKRLKKAVE